MPVGSVEFKTYYLPTPNPDVYSIIENPTVVAAKNLGLELQSKDVKDPNKLRAALLGKKLIKEIDRVPIVGAGLIYRLNTLDLDSESVPRETINGDYGSAEAFIKMHGNSDIVYFLKSPNTTEFATTENPGTEFIQNLYRSEPR